jgi:hypothetical protein
MDSLEKLTALLDACSELGVDTGPRTIGDLGIIPLYSWYHKVVILLLLYLAHNKYFNCIITHHVPALSSFLMLLNSLPEL